MPNQFAGLISAAPGKRNQALQTAARQVEAMVQQKMSQQEYIILCLEDSSDWNNATTRRTVMQVSRLRPDCYGGTGQPSPCTTGPHQQLLITL